MIVSCPECNARYNLTAKQLGPKGRKVRCAKCNHEWHQENTEAPVEVAAPIAPETINVKTTITDLGTKLTPVKIAAAAGVLLFLAAVTGFFVADPMELFGSNSNANTNNEKLVESHNGLIIDGVERSFKQDDALEIMVFTGTISNTSGKEVKVPTVRVSLLDASGIEIDFWPVQMNKKALQPGETTNWICRFFDAPMDKVAEYKVGFVVSD